MRPEQAAAYADALDSCTVGADKRNPERCAVVVDHRWCWTEPQLFAALDERARRAPAREPVDA